MNISIVLEIKKSFASLLVRVLYISYIFRGDDPDYGTTITIPRLEPITGTEIDAQAFRTCPEIGQPISTHKVPTVEDMLIAYATIPGYVANRDNMRGTWFIESICRVFMKNASDMDIKEMMDEVRIFISDKYAYSQ